MYQTNTKFGTQRHVRLTGGSSTELETPPYWHPGKGVAGPELLPLDPANPHMKQAWDDAASQLHATVPNAQVLEVSVLQDAQLWETYSMKKKHLASTLTGGANERRVFHGTSQANTTTIAKQGFLREYNTAAAYGRGTYFARDAKYSASDRFTPPNSSGEKFVFLARALIGEPCVGRRGMDKPTQQVDGGLHDSMVDRLQDPSIFVLSAGSDGQAYAELLIKFKI
jgi:poly [ADP-ribose] polymerase 10/14/15